MYIRCTFLFLQGGGMESAKKIPAMKHSWKFYEKLKRGQSSWSTMRKRWRRQSKECKKGYLGSWWCWCRWEAFGGLERQSSMIPLLLFLLFVLITLILNFRMDFVSWCQWPRAEVKIHDADRNTEELEGQHPSPGSRNMVWASAEAPDRSSEVLPEP